MRYIKLNLDDKDFEALEKAKNKASAESWEKFFLNLVR